MKTSLLICENFSINLWKLLYWFVASALGHFSCKCTGDFVSVVESERFLFLWWFSGSEEEMEIGDNATEDEELEEFKSPEQISSDLVTLSTLPNSRWQSLVHLDVIKVSTLQKFLAQIGFFNLKSTMNGGCQLFWWDLLSCGYNQSDWWVSDTDIMCPIMGASGSTQHISSVTVQHGNISNTAFSINKTATVMSHWLLL